MLLLPGMIYFMIKQQGPFYSEKSAQAIKSIAMGDEYYFYNGETWIYNSY